MSVLQKARFLLSAASVRDFPPEDGPEIAFVGRSNVGKSSALNALAGRRRLAFASKMPGRTQTINFFDLGGRGRIADLPGYGFANVPDSLRSGWDALIGGYLTDRPALAGIVSLMDARRPLTDNDRRTLDWLRQVPVPRLVLLSKSDKLSRAEGAKTLARTRSELERAAFGADVLLFSSKSGEGVDDARARIEAWLEPARKPSAQ